MRKGINFRFFQTLLGQVGLTPRRPAHHHHLPAGPGRYRWGRQLRDGEKPLSECREGEVICISRLVGGGPIRRRLLEMGLNPGSPLRIVKYAPLKDPLECEIKGYHVALRVSEAQSIFVTKTA